jgi:predicted signal transduction protein with EAL and GGDEF domain
VLRDFATRLQSLVRPTDADADGGWKGLVARADAMAYQAKANGRGQTALARRDEPTQIKTISGS